MAPNGEWTDFISDFLRLTEGEPSPEIYRKWAAISMIAAALERRVWIKAGVKIAYPNLFVLLVGRPGAGKQILELTRTMFREVTELGSSNKAFKTASDSCSKASFIDELVKTKSVRLPPQGPPIIYHSMYAVSEEFGVFWPNYDQEFIANFNRFWNNPPRYDETRRQSVVREVHMEQPQVNLLAGATPIYLVNTFPENAWETGFARRLIMIYAAGPPEQELFYEPEVPAGLRDSLLLRLSQMWGIFGQVRWTQEAIDLVAEWHRRKGPPRPTHSKLASTLDSRSLMVQKLAIVAAVSRTGDITIELQDMKRGIQLLLEVEPRMPDIFREMTGKSDNQVLEELHYFITTLWAKYKKPIPPELIVNFLRPRAPVEKIEKLFNTAAHAGIMVKEGEGWIPRPLSEKGDLE